MVVTYAYPRGAGIGARFHPSWATCVGTDLEVMLQVWVVEALPVCNLYPLTFLDTTTHAS
jgi:hypothetical protein